MLLKASRPRARSRPRAATPGANLRPAAADAPRDGTITKSPTRSRDGTWRADERDRADSAAGTIGIGRRQLRRRKQVAPLQSAEASVSSHTRGVSTTTVLILVGDEPEMLEWLEEFGLRPHSRALRFPTLDELRTAARSTNPTSMDERSSHGTWYTFLC